MRPEGLARPQCKSLCGAWAWVLRVGMGGPVLWVRKCALRLMWTALAWTPVCAAVAPRTQGAPSGPQRQEQPWWPCRLQPGHLGRWRVLADLGTWPDLAAASTTLVFCEQIWPLDGTGAVEE